MFRPENRVQIHLEEVKWIVLNEAMHWSKEIYDEPQPGEGRRAAGQFQTKEVWEKKKNKTAADKRMRAQQPW